MVVSSIQYSLIICINESPCLWIIIPAVQIIEPTLGIIVVSAVAEGVLLPDGARQAPRAGCQVPPRVVGIAYHLFPVWIQDPDDIPLQVLPVIVRSAC